MTAETQKPYFDVLSVDFNTLATREQAERYFRGLAGVFDALKSHAQKTEGTVSEQYTRNCIDVLERMADLSVHIALTYGT